MKQHEMNQAKSFSEKLFVGVFLLLLLLSSSSTFAQCSTSAWDSVTGTPQALGVLTIPVGKKYEQDCGLTIDAGSSPAYVTTTTPANEAIITARIYFLSKLLNITTGDVTLLRMRDGSTVQFEIRLRSSGSINHLVAFYRNNGILTEHGSTVPLNEVWQAIEVSWSAGVGNSSFTLLLDGVPQISRTNLFNGNAVINEVDLGVVNSATATGTVVFDAFKMNRSSPVGLLAVNELRNISTRADVRVDDEIIIGGFIVAGDTDKCVVVRGRGPSVNVPAGEVRLADPILVLKSGSTTIMSNDNWMDSPEASVIMSLGRQPTANAESAMFVCIPPGPYTALLRGARRETGVGIVEVFDADQGTSFLANISTRAAVKTGNLVAIGGFVIRGALSKQVLIRGRGPTVAVPAGVTRLGNPRLKVFDKNGLVLVNNNWGDATNAAAILATGRAPANALEAAILITFPPGTYTAIVDGAGGSTGVGIVEIIDLSGGSVTAQ